MKRVLPLLAFLLTACVSADPTLVARAVEATLTAVVTPTPIVVVVTVAGGSPASIPTVTPNVGVQQTLAAATETLAAASVTAPPASATAQPVGALAFVGKPIFTDDFTQPQLWPASDDSTHRIAVADGQLTITLKRDDRFTLVYNIKRLTSDFYAAVTGSAAACRFRDRYGLLFRLKDSGNYYQFEVDCDGRYRLSKVVNGALTPLKDWTTSEAINRKDGATNELSVRAEGETVEVFANGQPLFQTQDKTYAGGGFGLYAGSGLSASYTAVFDDLQVWELKP